MLVAIAVLLLGIWLGGRPEDLPGFMRSLRRRQQPEGGGPGSDQADLQRLLPPDLRSAAVELVASPGWWPSLHDRFSHYLTPSELREFDLPPHFAGIGVEVGDMRHGLQIARVFDNSPAARAGLQTGQVIVAVNGRPLQGLSRDRAVALIKGMPGTDVVLQIEAPTPATPTRPPRAA